MHNFQNNKNFEMTPQWVASCWKCRHVGIMALNLKFKWTLESLEKLENNADNATGFWV